MAVPSTLATDARVRRTARSVADLGHRVTLVWGDHTADEVVEGCLGGVRTIGLPVRYSARDRAASERPAMLTRAREDLAAAVGRRTEARRRADQPYRFPRLGFPDAPAQRRALKAAQGRVARATGLWERVSATVRAGIVRGRSRVFLAQKGRRRKAVLQARADVETARALVEASSRARPWRDELANIGDLNDAFVPWLCELEPDLLHLHDVHLLEAGRIAKERLSQQGRQVPLIYDAHEFLPGRQGRNPAEDRAYAEMESELLASCDAVITVSEQIADVMWHDHDLPERPTVTLNIPPLSDRAVETPRGDLRTELGLGEDVPLLVYSGGVAPARNVPAIIRATARLEGVHAAVICVPSTTVPGALELRSLAEDLGVTDRIHLVEPVEPEAIGAFIRTATLGVDAMFGHLAAHAMALPNKLFNYLHAGLPMVMSDASAQAAFVTEHGLGTTFDPHDVDAFADAVRRALASRAVHAARAADPELLATYSWENQARNLAPLYGKLVHR